mgnify:CR=1 FL=1
MNFRFSDEQRMIFDTASAFLAEVSDSAATRAAMASDAGFNPDVWQRLCNEMFWQGLLIPEDEGGLELGHVEMVGVLEKAGERLFSAPLYSTVLATTLLLRMPASDTRSALLARILAGEQVAVAHTRGDRDWATGGITASVTQDRVTLKGSSRFVSFGHSAEVLLICAHDNEQQLNVYGLEREHPGLCCERLATMDQTRAMAQLTLSDVTVEPSACLGTDVEHVVEDVLNVARILVAADQVGGAQAALDISVDYVKERQQFGRTIASYQAIKHKAADMMTKVEGARSLLYYAACIADEWRAGYADSATLAEAAAMVSASAGEAYFFNAGTGIQLHGGVGITEEYDIQLYFKRARATESYLGSPADHREHIARLLLDGD